MHICLCVYLWHASAFTFIQISVNEHKHRWCPFIYQSLHISLHFACGSQPQGWWGSFLKVSIFHLLVRSLINTVSMGSVCVEQMAQASLGEMKNANLSNAAKTTWLEISLGGSLNSHLKTHLAGTHTFLLSSALCTILIWLYLSSTHSALSPSAPPGRTCLLFPPLNMLYDYNGMILYSMFCSPSCKADIYFHLLIAVVISFTLSSIIVLIIKPIFIIAS